MSARLHVAALPFPTQQGTQAAIAAMLRAECREGRVARLLTYGHGDRPRAQPPVGMHVYRARPMGTVSESSGPSVGKLLSDFALASAARRLSSVLAPETLIGHHVEGALACLSTGARTVFFAHTDLGDELPCYFQPSVATSLRRGGNALDRFLLHRCDRVATVSPLLAERFAKLSPAFAPRVHHVPLPWEIAPRRLRAAGDDLRAQLDLPPHAQVAVYSGNLDAYQGMGYLIEALAIAVRALPSLHLLVATASETTSLRDLARSSGVAKHLRFCELGDPGSPSQQERRRAEVHALADVVVVPRASPGGLPIKLLDALARGVPVVAMPQALAGADYGDALGVAAAPNGVALAAELVATLQQPARIEGLAVAGPKYMRLVHSDAAFLAALDRVCARARDHRTEDQ